MKKLEALIGAIILAILSLTISLISPIVGIVFIIAIIIIGYYFLIRVLQEDNE